MTARPTQPVKISWDKDPGATAGYDLYRNGAKVASASAKAISTMATLATGDLFEVVGKPSGLRQQVTVSWHSVDVQPAPPPPAKQMFGFSTGYPQGSGFAAGITADAYAAQASSLGATLLRFDEPTPSSGANGRLAACQTHGQHVLMIVPYLADATMYASRCVALVNAYGPKVWAFELGNELNKGVISPEQYVVWHRYAWQHIKAAMPSAIVTTQGLSGYGSIGDADSKGINPVTYMQRCFAADPKFGECFDYLSIHPYPPFDIANATVAQLMDTSKPYNALGQLPAMYQLLDQHAPGKQVIVSEIGAPTANVTPSVQAGYVTAAIKWLRTQPRIAAVTWFTLMDSQTDGTFGIVGKPAEQAYRQAVA